VIALGFGVAERLVFRIDARGKSGSSPISLSVSEVPLVFALAFLQPAVAIAVYVVASGVVIIVMQRPSWYRTLFNASLFAFSCACAFMVTRQISEVGSDDAGRFLVAATIGATTAALIGLLVVCAALSRLGNAFWQMLRTQVGTVFVAGATGATLGAIALSPALIGLEFWPLSIAPVLAVWFMIRQHGNLTRNHRELVDLHAFSAALDQSLDLDVLAQRAVSEIGRLLNADRVTLRLLRTAEEETRTWHLGEPRVPTQIAGQRPRDTRIVGTAQIAVQPTQLRVQ